MKFGFPCVSRSNITSSKLKNTPAACNFVDYDYDWIMKFIFGKIYYGWYILAGAVLAQFAATSTGQMVSGVLLDPLVEELNIKVWQFAAAVSLATAVGAISVVFIGPLVDRLGPRPLMLAGAVFCALGLVGLSLQSTLFFFFLKQESSCYIIIEGFFFSPSP